MFGSILTFVLLWTYVSGYTVSDCPAAVQDTYTQVYNSTCYRFALKESLEYVNANKHCMKHGGTLVLIKSEDVDKFIYNTLLKTYNYHGTAWIGLNDIEEEHVYKWVDGTLMDYQNFSPGTEGPMSPPKHYVEDCAAIDTTWHGYWRDYHCEDWFFGYVSEHMPFICQYPIASKES